MDLEYPALEVCEAFVARFQGEPYDLDALRGALRERIAQAEAWEPSIWREHLLRTCRQLGPIISMIEDGQFDDANTAMQFVGRW